MPMVANKKFPYTAKGKKAAEEYANQQGWISCTIAGPGWSYVDGVFTAPVEQTTHETPTPTKEELLQQITALQQQIESLV